MNQNIINFTILILAFYYIPVATTQNVCPRACDCTILPDQCYICLQKLYKRSFTTNNSCPCITGYAQNHPPTDYCCAKNCISCYEKGCYKCRANWTLILVDNWNICQCKINYYLASNKDCLCLAERTQKNQLVYFKPSRFECYICPNGCSCNKSGCYYCKQFVNRIIDISAQNISTCYCKSSYFQINGTCFSDSLLIICQFPMIYVNNICLCQDPYYKNSHGDCVCKSQLSQTSYYKYLEMCYICPKQCKCSKIGCYYCSIYANRTIIANNCSCSTLADGVNRFRQIDGHCKCIDPYNLNTCQCNSILYPTLFYMSSSQFCKKCPIGCTCSEQMLIFCNNYSNRDSNGICKSFTIELDGQCIGCTLNFIYTNKSCVCPNVKFISLSNKYYFDQDTNSCLVCPLQCNCTKNGCIYCNSTTHRVKGTNSKNITTCFCDKEYQETSQGICQCSGNKTYDNGSDKCLCILPYILSADSRCLCSAEIFPNLYYYDQNLNCLQCPIQCKCSRRGCIQCSENTGRVIMISGILSICPCLPSNTQSNGYCLICSIFQYVWKNLCMNCHPNCVTCNAIGCTSCSAITKLENNMCVCSLNDTGNNIRNQQGKCICMKEYYYLDQTATCQLCPLNCKNYQFNKHLSGYPFCIQCNIYMHRLDNLQLNCPCIPYYLENIIKTSYCCHWTCMTCDINGCTSCLPFTFRFLNITNPSNATCSCPEGFNTNYQNVCECPPQTYLQFDQCLACLPYCYNCSIFNFHLSCFCFNNLNRVTKQLFSVNPTIIHYDCICKDDFIEIDIDDTYCYPQWCAIYSTQGKCAQCIQNRILSKDNLTCTCVDGYYLDQHYMCQICSQGCISCQSFYVCNRCDDSNNYYRIFNKLSLKIICIKPDYSHTILYQDKNLFIFMAQLNNTMLINNLQMFLITLNKNVEQYMIQLFFKNSDVSNSSLLIMQLNALNKTYFSPYLFYINGTLNGFSNDLESSTWEMYFYIDNILYTPSVLAISPIKEAFTILFLILIMVFSIVLHVLGSKQNQLMYCSQTLYFVSMNVKDSNMATVPYLNNFGIMVFNLIFADRTSPLNKIIQNWDEDIQYSIGNYKYFNIDNNLMRNAGLALYLAIQNIILLIIFKIIYQRIIKSNNEHYRIVIKKYKKTIYRVLEWVFKVTMYPVLFFAFSTLIVFKDQYSLQNQSFRYTNIYIALTIIITYVIVNIFNFFFNQVSKLHKYEMIIQTFFDVISSITIAYSNNSISMLIMILIILLRSLIQMINIFLWKRYNNKKQNIVLIFLNVVQSFMIFGIYYQRFNLTMFLIILYLIGITLFRIYILKNYNRYLRYHRRDPTTQTQKQQQLKDIII